MSEHNDHLLKQATVVGHGFGIFDELYQDDPDYEAVADQIRAYLWTVPQSATETRARLRDTEEALRAGDLAGAKASIAGALSYENLSPEHFRSAPVASRYALLDRPARLPWPVAWQGTAAETAGVDRYAPLQPTFLGGQNEKIGEQYARRAALAGETHPYSLMIGQPRIYRYDLLGLPPEEDGKGLLKIKANQDWQSAFKRIAPELGHFGGDDDFNFYLPQDAEEVFFWQAKAEQLWRDLIDDARKLARDHGYAAFELSGGLKKEGSEVKSVGEMVFLTEQSLPPTQKKVVGYLPGMPGRPTAEDLVLYHGGQRALGAVGLDFRPTSKGENQEPLPILLNTPAVWGKIHYGNAWGYSISRKDACEAAGIPCEPHVYTLDAPDAVVGEVFTKDLTQRQANAVMRELLSRPAGERPDVLRLHRKSGGEEYFIPEGDYEPTIVQVANAESHPTEIPRVQTVAGLEFGPPSAELCDLQPKAAPTMPSDYWQRRCAGEEYPGVKRDLDFQVDLIPRHGLVAEARRDYYQDIVDKGEPGMPAVRAILKAAPTPPGNDLHLKAMEDRDNFGKPPQKRRPRGRDKERPAGGGALPSITIQR